MAVIVILILASLAMALFFLGGFIWAVRSGQFDDTCTPSMRVLPDDAAPAKEAGLCQLKDVQFLKPANDVRHRLRTRNDKGRTIPE